VLRLSPRRLAARIAIAASVVGIALLATGAELLRLLAPGIAAATDALSPLAVPHVAIAGGPPHAGVEAIGIAMAAIPVGRDAYLPPATRLGPVSISLVHTLVPLALLLTALAAWPCAARREAMCRFAIAFPAILVVVFATVPLHLAALLEAYVDAHRLADGDVPVALPVVEGMLFLEAGGRWLIPLVVATACVVIGRRPSRVRRADRAMPPLDAELVAAAREARRQRIA
jgi:hypothetical protein